MGFFNWGIYFGYGMAFLLGNYVTAADISGLVCYFRTFLKFVSKIVKNPKILQSLNSMLSMLIKKY